MFGFSRRVAFSASRRARIAGRAAAFSVAAAAVTTANAGAPALDEERSIAALLAAPVTNEDGELIARRRMVHVATGIQDAVCRRLEEIDGAAAFREDSWDRESGGGGITRVMTGGKVVEKAGVNVSVLFGQLTKQQRAAMRNRCSGEMRDYLDKCEASELPVRFFASGVSLIVHPLNPRAPTVHANVRFFEIINEHDAEKASSFWWVGGGADLTPHYLYEDDAELFHRRLKEACDRHDPSWFGRFKKWADDYFYIPHRGEHRGIGGIFFDDLNDRPQGELLDFLAGVGDKFLDAYGEILERRHAEPYGPREREWQELRHGRYAEFNLVYDRGTKFGLNAPTARTESILVSLPLTCRFEYDPHPAPGSDEEKCLRVLKEPRDWVKQ